LVKKLLSGAYLEMAKILQFNKHTQTTNTLFGNALGVCQFQ